MLPKFKDFQYDKLRLELFSDAVFAIVITLLILEIKVPHFDHNAHLGSFHAFLGLKDKVFCWVLSFLFVGVGWVQHHNIMYMIKKTDLAFVWMNLFCLMGFCFIPFATAFMGENIHDAFAITLFCATAAFTSFMLCVLYMYGVNNFFKESYDAVKAKRNATIALIASPSLYIISAGFAWCCPTITYVILILIPLVFVFPLDKETK